MHMNLETYSEGVIKKGIASCKYKLTYQLFWMKMNCERKGSSKEELLKEKCDFTRVCENVS